MYVYIYIYINIYIRIYIINQPNQTNPSKIWWLSTQPDGMSKLSIHILEGQELIRQPWIKNNDLRGCWRWLDEAPPVKMVEHV